MKILKKYWGWLAAVIILPSATTIILNSTQAKATEVIEHAEKVWESPNNVEEIEGQVEDINTYIAAQQQIVEHLSDSNTQQQQAFDLLKQEVSHERELRKQSEKFFESLVDRLEDN